MKLEKLAGATSEIWQIFIRDSSSTTGAGLTGLAFNTASLTAYYNRDTDSSPTAITLATMTAGTFTSSGFKEISSANMPGWYQFCPPNAAIASGAKTCGFHLKGATNMAPLPIEVQLVSYNPDAALATPTNITAGTITTVTTVTNQLTAAQVATGVWQDTTAGDFTTALSIGKSVMNGVSLGTGLTIAAVSGAVGSVTGAAGSVTGNVGGNVTGSVGSVIGLTASNLDATISSRLASASYTAPDNTSIAAIKVQTDKLVFTAPGYVDVNVLKQNGATMYGTGTAGDLWRGTP